MTDLLEPLKDVPKLLFEIPLKPLQGHRFQPTGFPSLGAATYQTPNGTSLLVESPQSMANHLELVCWDETRQVPCSELAGISYVSVNRDGRFLTSSILQAHRLNSGYIRSTKERFHNRLREEMAIEKEHPIDSRAFISTIFKYDVNSLVHGVFLDSIDGRLRVRRTLSAFIEANRVERAVSGGVKTDSVDPSGDPKPDFGMVPFSREEFVSDEILLYVNCDLAQVRGFPLSQEQKDLLVVLQLFKLRKLLVGNLRLRTACELALKDDRKVESMCGFELPEIEALQSKLTTLLGGENGLTGTTTLEFDPETKKRPKKKGAEDDDSLTPEESDEG